MKWLIFALVSAVLSGTSAVVSKKALNKESAVEFSTALALVNVLVSIPLMFWLDISLSPLLWGIIFFIGLTAALGFLLTAKALKHMEISLVSPLRNFGPALVAVFAFFLLGEQLTLVQGTGVLSLAFGAYVLEIDFKEHNLTAPFKAILESKYIHLLFLSLGLYALSSIGGKYVLNSVNPVTLLFLTQFFVALVFLFYISVFHNGLKDVKEGFKRAGWLIAVIAILTVSYRLLQYNSMNLEYVSLVIPIKRLDTLFSTVMGGEFFHEHGLVHKVIACVIMILGATMIVLG